MKRRCFPFLLFLFLPVLFFAQEYKPFSLGVEYGMSPMSGSLDSRWSVRQDVGTYPSTYYKPENLCVSSDYFYFSIKPEYLFHQQRFSLSSGLRFSVLNNEIYSTSPFFHLRYNMSGATTEYARIRNISESNYYLGVPIEFQWRFINTDYFRFYVKTGMTFNFNISNDKDIVFVNESMNEYEQNIFDEVGIGTNLFFSNIYMAWGINIGTINGLKLNIEYLAPGYSFYKNDSFIINMDNYYQGFQFSIQMPLGKNRSKE